MKDLVKYYFTLARYLYYKYKQKVDLKTTGRVCEGIAIGIYATVIDKFVDNGITLDLTLKFVIAIIITYAALILQKKDT